MSASSGKLRTYSRRTSCWLGVGLLGASVASASTPEAWSAYQQEVVKTCVAASSLRGAHAAGERIDFDDDVGLSALLIAGDYPQPHMKNQHGRELCLFNKYTRTAWMADADRLISAQPTPTAR
jgi:hypothetical protein